MSSAIAELRSRANALHGIADGVQATNKIRADQIRWIASAIELVALQLETQSAAAPPVDSIPDGEITDAMIEAGLEAADGDDGRSNYLWIDGDKGACISGAGVSAVYRAMLQAAPQPAAGETFDLVAHLHRQRTFSERTFGPGTRTLGVIDHIRKELREIEADPADTMEWIDVVLLALDGAWRHGASPEQIAAAIEAKQTKNEGRKWPDWRTMPTDKGIEHDRSADAPQPPAHDDGWRPIETAPKDGTIFDVWLGNASDDDVAFYCTEGTRRSCGWSWEKGKFRPLGGLKVAMPVFEVPTHWQPLPQPPVGEEE